MDENVSNHQSFISNRASYKKTNQSDGPITDIYCFFGQLMCAMSIKDDHTITVEVGFMTTKIPK